MMNLKLVIQIDIFPRLGRDHGSAEAMIIQKLKQDAD